MIAEDEKHAGPGASRTIQVSMLEIYNDAVRDLLRNKGDVAAALDVSGMGPGQLPPDAERVPGLTWRPVSCMQEVPPPPPRRPTPPTHRKQQRTLSNGLLPQPRGD